MPIGSVVPREISRLNEWLGDEAVRYDVTVKVAVLRRCPDPELAAVALQMLPRPEWVEKIAGPWIPACPPRV